ncbi:uncharacterized protein LOC144752415 [Lissotriton helveticus]
MLAANCEFDNFTSQLIRDQLVARCYCKEIQKKLLTCKDPSLDKAVDIAKSIETSMDDVKQLETALSSTAISGAVSSTTISGATSNSPATRTPFMPRGNFRRPYSSRGGGFRQSDSRMFCYRCGSSSHVSSFRNCPAANQQCGQCGKMGHFAKICMRGRRGGTRGNVRCVINDESMNENDDNFSYEGDFSHEDVMHQEYVVVVMDSHDKSISHDIPDPEVDVIIGKDHVQLLVDTGARITIISQDKYTKFWHDKSLLPPDILTVAFEGSRINLLGFFWADINVLGVTIKGKVYVAKKGINVLGLIHQAEIGLTIKPGLANPVFIDKQIRDTPVTTINNNTLCTHTHDTWEQKFSKIFENRLGKITNFQHTIRVKDNVVPTKHKLRNVPLSIRSDLSKHLKALCDQGIIEKVESTLWLSPIVLAKKRSGDLRMCVDLRTLNEAIWVDGFPLPRIEDLIAKVGSSSWFTKLDLKAAYHQVELDPQSRHLTAFVTPDGVFQFCRLPFGLASAAAVFQRLMSEMFAHNPNVVVFQDDILIFTKTESEHDQAINEVFEVLENRGLTLQKAKCIFKAKEIEYLGHIISEKGIKPRPGLVKSIIEAPAPQNREQLLSFLVILGLTLICGAVKISTSQCALETEYFCSGIPQEYPENLKSILFILTNIGVINSTVFTSANLKSVTSLTLANSGITRIEPGALHAFQGLTKLALYGNHLTTFAPAWFSNPGRLDNLTMTGNKIQELKPYMLSGFLNLTILNLAKNEIRSLSSGSFSNLPRVTQIDLSDNRLTTLKRDVFDDRRYPMVKLSGNPWNCTCELQDFSVFLQELKNASRLEDASSVICHSPLEVKGIHVWNVSVFNCSSDITSSTTDNLFRKAGLPIIIVVCLALLIIFWVLLMLWKKKQDSKQVQPDQEHTVGKRMGEKSKEPGIFIISKGPLNVTGPEKRVRKALQKVSDAPSGTTKGRARSASAILLRSQFPKASVRQPCPNAEKKEPLQYTNEMLTEHGRRHGGHDNSMEEWYFNSLKEVERNPFGSDGADLTTVVQNIYLLQDPAGMSQFAMQPQTPQEGLRNDGQDAITKSDNTEPLLYFSIDREPEDSRHTEDGVDNSATPVGAVLGARPIRRTLTWPQARRQQSQDQGNVWLEEDFLKAKHGVLSQQWGRFMAKTVTDPEMNTVTDPEGQQPKVFDLAQMSLNKYEKQQFDPTHRLKEQTLSDDMMAQASEEEEECQTKLDKAYLSPEGDHSDYDLVLNSLKTYRLSQLDEKRGTKEQATVSSKFVPSTKKGVKAGNALERAYTTPIRKATKGVGTTRSRQKTHSPPESHGNSYDDDVMKERAGHTGSPADDTLLENNEYNFIDLLHEVVENHGRWTRERWKQTHQQRMASRPFLQTQ